MNITYNLHPVGVQMVHNKDVQINALKPTKEQVIDILHTETLQKKNKTTWEHEKQEKSTQERMLDRPTYLVGTFKYIALKFWRNRRI